MWSGDLVVSGSSSFNCELVQSYPCHEAAWIAGKGRYCVFRKRSFWYSLCTSLEESSVSSRAVGSSQDGLRFSVAPICVLFYRGPCWCETRRSFCTFGPSSREQSALRTRFLNVTIKVKISQIEVLQPVAFIEYFLKAMLLLQALPPCDAPAAERHVRASHMPNCKRWQH